MLLEVAADLGGFGQWAYYQYLLYKYRPVQQIPVKHLVSFPYFIGLCNDTITSQQLVYAQELTKAKSQIDLILKHASTIYGEAANIYNIGDTAIDTNSFNIKYGENAMEKVLATLNAYPAAYTLPVSWDAANSWNHRCGWSWGQSVSGGYNISAVAFVAVPVSTGSNMSVPSGFNLFSNAAMGLGAGDVILAIYAPNYDLRVNLDQVQITAQVHSSIDALAASYSGWEWTSGHDKDTFPTLSSTHYIENATLGERTGNVWSWNLSEVNYLTSDLALLTCKGSMSVRTYSYSAHGAHKWKGGIPCRYHQTEWQASSSSNTTVCVGMYCYSISHMTVAGQDAHQGLVSTGPCFQLLSPQALSITANLISSWQVVPPQQI